MKILFIGATGMLGKPVAKELIRSGFELTLLARNENKMRNLFPESVIVKGDVYDKESLVKAMQGQQAIYMNLSIDQGSGQKDPQAEKEGLDNIIEAAKETGIQRLAYLSSLVHLYNGMNGFDWWAFHVKKQAVEKIKGSRIPFTIFYPSTFMETFPYQSLRGNKVMLLGKSEAPMWFIAAEDYAGQVARSFEITRGNENKEYIIQGPVAYTFDEAAKIFTGHYQQSKLSIAKLPMGLVKCIGLFVKKLNYGWHICEALNRYPEKFDSEQTWNELGKPEMSLADFAKNI